MRRILHILTSADDALARQVIVFQQQQPDQQVNTIDLTAAEPDYHALLYALFAADSVEVW